MNTQRVGDLNVRIRRGGVLVITHYLMLSNRGRRILVTNQAKGVKYIYI